MEAFDFEFFFFFGIYFLLLMELSRFRQKEEMGDFYGGREGDSL